jgi:hypothetical protein
VAEERENAYLSIICRGMIIFVGMNDFEVVKFTLGELRPL